MNIDITGRSVRVSPALREFTEFKLRKLERFLDEPVDAHVVLEITKHRHIAEIQLKGGSSFLAGKEETDDLYASIKDVADKLERQARKQREKKRDHRIHRGVRVTPEPSAPVAVGESESVEPAPPTLARSRSYRIKPMRPEDAVFELEESAEPLLVYRDSETLRINVVHRLDDGTFGLVDPEF